MYFLSEYSHSFNATYAALLFLSLVSLPKKVTLDPLKMRWYSSGYINLLK